MEAHYQTTGPEISWQLRFRQEVGKHSIQGISDEFIPVRHLARERYADCQPPTEASANRQNPLLGMDARSLLLGG